MRFRFHPISPPATGNLPLTSQPLPVHEFQKLRLGHIERHFRQGRHIFQKIQSLRTAGVILVHNLKRASIGLAQAGPFFPQKLTGILCPAPRYHHMYPPATAISARHNAMPVQKLNRQRPRHRRLCLWINRHLHTINPGTLGIRRATIEKQQRRHQSQTQFNTGIHISSITGPSARFRSRHSGFDIGNSHIINTTVETYGKSLPKKTTNQQLDRQIERKQQAGIPETALMCSGREGKVLAGIVAE